MQKRFPGVMIRHRGGGVAFKGASSTINGNGGGVPGPNAGDQGKFLRGDATWQTIPGGGDMLSANDLAEVATSATKRSTSRTNLDVLWKDDVYGLFESHAPRAGLFCNGNASAALNGSGGVNLGLMDFSISMVLALPDYTPASQHTLWASHISGNNRVQVYLTAGGQFNVGFYDNTGALTAVALVPDVALVDGETYHVLIACDRDGLATLYINGISDRDKNGSGVSASIAATSNYDIGNGNATSWTAMVNCIGTFFGLRVYNRALSAAEALQLSKFGTAAPNDQWGKLTPDYTSNFSGGADSFTVSTGVTVSGNTDAVLGIDDTLKVSTDNSTGAHIAARANTLSLFKRYRISMDYYIPNGQTVGKIRVGAGTNADPSGFVNGYSGVSYDLPVTGSWQSVTFELVSISSVSLYIVLLTAAGATTFTGVTGESVYIKNLKVTEIGALMDLDLANADPSQSLTIRDMSGQFDGTAVSGRLQQLSRDTQLNAGFLTVGGAAILKKLLTNTASLDFPSIGANSSADLPITVTGAVVNDSVSLGLPASPPSGLVFNAFVSAVNTVTVRAFNVTGAPIDAASITIRATVFQF